MIIIDSHTHWYPEFISKDPFAWALANGEDHWSRLMAHRDDGKASLQGFPSIEKFLNDMDAAQIDRAIIQGWYWQKAENCLALNRAVSEAISPYADRLSAFAAVNPASKTLEEDLKAACEMGFIGIGELHDSVQGFTFESEKFEILCNFAAKKNLPVSIHLSDSDGKDYPNKTPTDNQKIYQAARVFDDVKFILSHWGGGEVFKPGFIPLENVFYDTAANSFLYGKNAWKAVKGALSDKIIYGSDYPLRLYPSSSSVEEMVIFSTEAAANVPPENLEKFFSTNFLFIYE